MRRWNKEPAHGSPLIKKAQAELEPPQVELLVKAYTLSKEKGIETNCLPYKAAALLLEHGADADTIAAALLAQDLWGGRASKVEIRKALGNTVVNVLDGIKPSCITGIESGLYSQERMHAFLESAAKTPRKALLLIAFRFIELDNALQTNSANSRPLAQETLDFYVPIANRLSLGGLRRRLEDLCLNILEPTEYESLKLRVAPMQAEDASCLRLLMKGVRRFLSKAGLQAELKARIKSLYGIRRKMIRTGKSLNEIIDRLGMRIIVASVPECYTVLGLLHTHFKPIHGTFDDYIGLPKENGYQSLHTCVYPVREISHKPIEFQVRTKLMHMEAEYGSAAHWMYKNESSPKKGFSGKEWIKGLLHRHERADSLDAFLEMLHRQVYSDQLVVFGNGGRIIRLPENATVQDYLESSIIRFGQDTVVRVNGKAAGIDSRLQDGDSIEIIMGDKLKSQETAGSVFKARTMPIDKTDRT
jgi:GTP pyrophosphokinase